MENNNKNKDKFYITTAIAYTSKKPHIGNTYEAIFADSIARYNRMLGKDVFFLTGTDEHGQKIQELAEGSNKNPQDYVNEVAGEIQSIWDLMNVSYNKFIRTTDSYHVETVQKIFKKLYDQGDIYLGEYEGNYCIPCETFFTDTQLVDGKCPDCGRDVKKAKEEAYFLKCSKYQDKLLEYIEAHPDFITPKSREKEIINNFLKPGLQDLCVSRTSFTWGIPVTFNEKHVVYVWLDALTNYITALGYNLDSKNVDENNAANYTKYWPANVQIVGKDILRFHMVYWPIILMALGEPLPQKIYAHGWLLFGQDKMSKSKGNVIYADDLAKVVGVDGTRYYVLSSMSYSEDGSITYDEILSKYNTDLANTIGNLVTRTVTMVNKYFDGNVYNNIASEAFDELSKEFVKTIEASVNKYNQKMQELKVAEAIDEAINIARRSNKYIDETLPWSLAKTDEGKEELKHVLYNLIESIRIIAVMLKCIIPTAAENILGILNASTEELTSLESISSFGKMPSQKVNEAKIIFARLDDKVFANEQAKVEEKTTQIVEETKTEPSQKASGISDINDCISIEDVDKVKLKVAKILSVERIKDSNKLYKLEVDLGYETRTVVSGLVPYYKEEELLNKKVVLVSNLKPAKLKGVMSSGMILAAGDNDIVKVLFVDDNVPLGESIK